MSDWKELGIGIPEILLPRVDIDLRTWAVVAADQYTSQLEYWERVDRAVGERPSTLRLILPEVYLGRPDVDARIAAIQATMRRYLDDGVFRAPLSGLLYVDRKTGHVPSRKGLIVALDLERYDYRLGATSLVRATERTVEERLPPRVQVRRGATLELPHVMVLIDDVERRVIEPLAAHLEGAAPLYASELMEGGGSIRAWQVPEALLGAVQRGLAALAAPDGYRARYGVGGDEVLLYAVGDGNHSLASAKVHWEAIKAGLGAAERQSHPARHALVELVNVHDAGLVFEPIHRVAFDVDPDALLAAMVAHFEARGGQVTLEPASDDAAWQARLSQLWAEPGTRVHAMGFVAGDRRGVLRVEGSRSNLPVGTLQTCLDEVLPGAAGSSLDYIHGKEVLVALASEPRRLGFYLPAMHKGDLFKTVVLDGVLPRKTFSMGEADEKRFYLEARRIER